MNEDERYERARKQVQELKDFYIHLSIYIIFNAFAVFVGLSQGVGWWILALPVLWGIGLVAHAIDALPAATGWEERKIRELMAKEERKAKEDYFYEDKQS